MRRSYLVATSSWFLAFGMQGVVFAWLVTMVLHEPAENVGWAQTALLLPGMLLILLAGSLADRVGPDRQAMWAQLAAALSPWLLIAAIRAEMLTYPVMLVYAVIMGCAQAFVTPARDGLLNHVAEGRVQHTVLLASLCQFSFQIAGYAVAWFADVLGPEIVLGVQSISLMIGVLAYHRLNPHIARTSRSESHSVVEGVIEGARTVFASPVMRVVVIQNVAMACFFMGSFIVSFPLVVREVFAGSSSELAFLNGFNSLGLVLTILLMLRVGHVAKPGRALLLFQGLGSAVLFMGGLIDQFWLFVLIIFVWGLCGGIAMPMSRTLMQEIAPPEQRSRVMSFYAFSFMGAGPLGTLLCGYLSALIGPQQAIMACAAAMLAVVCAVGLFTQLWSARSDSTVAGDGVQEEAQVVS